MSSTDNGGVDVSNFLRTLSAGDFLYIQQASNSSAAILVKLTAAPTDNGSWFELTVEYDSDGGQTIQNNSNTIFSVLGNENPSVAETLSTANLFLLKDQKSSGINGGDSTAATWTKRDLNTVAVDNVSGASLSSSQITLPAGTYYVSASCPHGSDATQYNALAKARLRNITDATTTLVGTSVAIQDGGAPLATLEGYFTIASTKVFELQHYRSDTRTNGFGLATSSGESEVYSTISIWKVA